MAEGKDEVSGVVVVLLLATMCVTLLAGGTLFYYLGVSREQQKAIQMGVGRWVIDATTGEREFRYGKRCE